MSDHIKEMAPDDAMMKLWEAEEQFRNRAMSAELVFKQRQKEHARVVAACKAHESRVIGTSTLWLIYERSIAHRTNMLNRRIIQEEAEAFVKGDEG